MQRLHILEDGQVDESKFDQLMGLFLAQDDGTEIVVDNGAASFIPVCDYLIRNQAIELLQAEGHRVFAHSVVTGGLAFRDTLSGFDSLVSQFPDGTQHILWTYRFFGDLEYQDKMFDELKVIQRHKDRLFGIIHIPKQDRLFASDMRTMLENHQTFEDAAADTSLGFMSRYRLSIIRDKTFQEIGSVLGAQEHD